MAKKYGVTWWGKAWLDALNSLDVNNYLKRGKRFANAGNVKKLEIIDRRVNAICEDNHGKVYKIKITLNRYKEEELLKLKKIIQNNPVLAAELEIGKLSPDLFTAIQNDNIPLYPESFEEISAICFCNEKERPCKHMSAVYFNLINEIDKNPFIIFELRGLTEENIKEWTSVSVEVDDEKEIFAELDLFLKADTEKMQEFNSDDVNLNLDIQNMDIESIFSVLPKKPVFYNQSDFWQVLYKIYKSAVVEAEGIEINEEYPDFRHIDFHLIYDENLGDFSVFGCYEHHIPTILKEMHPVTGKPQKIKVPELKDGKIVISNKRALKLDFKEFLKFFMEITLDITDEKNSRYSKFINALISTAMTFVKNSCFVPELIKLENNDFKVIYRPVLDHATDCHCVDYLAKILPSNMFFDTDLKILNKDTMFQFLSFFLTKIVHIFLSYVMDFKNTKMINVFVDDIVYKCNTFSEENIGDSVTAWLERLYFRTNKISPIIKLDIAENDMFSLKVDVQDKNDPFSNVIPLDDIVNMYSQNYFGRDVKSVQNIITRQLLIASEYMPQLKDILENASEKEVFIDGEDIVDILTKTVNIFDILGIDIVIPKKLSNIKRPELTLKADAIDEFEDKISYFSLESMLNFSYEISLGKNRISKKEFTELLKKSKGIIEYKGEFILVDPNHIKKLLERMKKPVPEFTTQEIIFSALTGKRDDCLFYGDGKVKKIFENILKPIKVDLPVKLNAKLRDYQVRGFNWLYSNIAKGFGCCIADDMGLGKTLQVISLILRLKEEGSLKKPAIVICPMSIVTNWKKEFEKFAPDLKINIYHGDKRKMYYKNSDVVITTYGILRMESKKFESRKWSLCIIDEAQNIKNPMAVQTKCVKKMKADSYIAMTGTPVENRIVEMWSIFDFINKGYLGNLVGFKRDYATPIEKYKDKEVAETFRLATAPFILRRLKNDRDIIKDLPEKIIFDEYCELSKEQAALYQNVLDNITEDISKDASIKRKGLIFKLMTALKQICNHPVHYTKKGKAVAEHSGKIKVLFSILEKAIENNEKVLLFTQYKEMGDILSDMIEERFEEKPLFLHGQKTRKKRDEIVKVFQEEKGNSILIASLKAAGTGLNLTKATKVVHFDLWWNPAVEEQATDRTYRIGQMKNVFVYRLISAGTFEEKINNMLKEKRNIANMAVSAGEKFITEMSDNELKEIFELTR